MSEFDAVSQDTVLERIRAQAATENVRITPHAQQELVEEDITLGEVLEAIAAADILENYPEHRRGACCLLGGLTRRNRPVHVVCTTTLPMLVIITVYEPRLPKWMSPSQRRQGK